MGGVLLLAVISTASTQVELPRTRDGAAAWRAVLGHREVRVRDAAQARLMGLGCGALSLLEELRRDPDPEVRARAEWLYSHLALFEPTEITLLVPDWPRLFAPTSITVQIPGSP